MDIKLIEQGVNGSNEKVYLMIIDYGDDVKSLKLTEREVKSFAKQLWKLTDDIR